MDLILNKYNLSSTEIESIQKGYRNSSYILQNSNAQLVNLIIYKKEPSILSKIKVANYISRILHKNGLPVRYPIGKILKLKEDYYACLYNYLPGKAIPWEGYTMKHLKLLGEFMNKIHFATSDSKPIRELNLESENLKLLINRMQNYFTKDLLQVIQRKLNLKLNLDFLEEASQVISRVDEDNMKIILHMDFVRGNILFEDKPEIHISGILDFEKSSYGSPLFDIARTLAFLFVDCKYKSKTKIRKYFLKSGYIKRGVFKVQSYKYLNDLIAIYLIYDFYKFLKHNPYEFLQSNEHFIRTKDLLIKMNIVEQIN